MRVDILTLFPRMFEGPFSEGLAAKAQQKGLVQIRIHNLMSWVEDPRKRVDDRPFGGGAGMVLRPEPIYRALKSLGALRRQRRPWVIYLSPQGKQLSQSLARSLFKKKRLVLLCGHYEGVDERVMKWVDQEISIGDFVLMGGEIPAMALTEAVVRLVPGVVGDQESIEKDSFSGPTLDYPSYTRPRLWRSRAVPAVLLSGDHGAIERWRRKRALQVTKAKRRDLLL
jgi:tRNA (guanine37-N1)-methyltransferase